MDDALMYHKKYNWGIYAPNVDYTWHDSLKTDVPGVVFDEESIRLVGCPDCTCWFIDRSVVDAFRASKIDMTPYKMGWGWDLIFPAISYMLGRPVLRDYSHTIDHPPGTGYNKNQAEYEMNVLFQRMPIEIRDMANMVKFGFRNLEKMVLRKKQPKDNKA